MLQADNVLVQFSMDPDLDLTDKMKTDNNKKKNPRTQFEDNGESFVCALSHTEPEAVTPLVITSCKILFRL